MSELIELHQPLPTRYNKENLQVSRLDTGFASLPGSLIIRLGISPNIICSPEGMSYANLSDHSPLEICVTPKHLEKNGQKSIPIHWCTHFSFEDRLSELMHYVNFSGLPPFERLHTYKTCIRNAALHSRDV